MTPALVAGTCDTDIRELSPSPKRTRSPDPEGSAPVAHARTETDKEDVRPKRSNTLIIAALLLCGLAYAVRNGPPPTCILRVSHISVYLIYARTYSRPTFSILYLRYTHVITPCGTQGEQLLRNARRTHSARAPTPVPLQPSEDHLSVPFKHPTSQVCLL